MDIELNSGPRLQCRYYKNYCKASDKIVKCGDCEKRFNRTCAKLGDEEHLESGIGTWDCTNCKTDYGLCSGAVLKPVNSEIFTRILFSRIALKDICDVKNREQGMIYLYQ